MPFLHLPMTLRRKFLLHNLLLVGALLLAGAVSVWRLGVLRGEVDLSRNVYAELRTVGNVGVDVGIVRGLLASPEANRDQLVTYLGFAVGGLEQFITVGKGYGPGSDPVMVEAYVPMNHTAAAARQRLLGLLDRYKAGGPITAAAAEADRKTVDAAMEDLDHVATSCLNFVSSRQQTASSHLAANVILIAGLSLAAVLAAIGLSVYHDRLVMAPLQRLRQGVRRVAEAQFTDKLDPRQMTASPEFVELAEEFNRMGSELDGFYRKLEEQVRTKSRELVRSERLASVGFLAAGVAHEINNPLNIISGYAELTDKQLEPGRGRLALALDSEDALRARECLKIIRDEAFRCKEITDKLLSLARHSSDSREALDLSGVAREVASMTHGLKNYRDRRLTLKLDPTEPLEVQANLTEMKQVLLNLTINALEAVPPVDGEVCIEGHRTRDWVELSVKDNGRGMCADVLQHVFEPFFTARRGSGSGPGDRGTGLGLSITHAIIESHGGRIQAESEGVGHGARFTVRLPANGANRRMAAATA